MQAFVRSFLFPGKAVNFQPDARTRTGTKKNSSCPIRDITRGDCFIPMCSTQEQNRVGCNDFRQITL